MRLDRLEWLILIVLLGAVLALAFCDSAPATF